MALADAELEKHYQDLFAMYGTPGWKALQAQLAEMFTNHNTLVGLVTEADLNFRKGQIDIIAFFIGHEDQHERAYNELIAQEVGGEPEQPTGGVARVIAEDVDPEPL